MKSLSKKILIFLIFALGEHGYSREFVIVVERSMEGTGTILEYELTKTGLTPTGRKAQIPYANECAISPNSDFSLILTQPENGVLTSLTKIDLPSWTVSETLVFNTETITSGGALGISPNEPFAVVTDNLFTSSQSNRAIVNLKNFSIDQVISPSFSPKIGKFSKKGNFFWISADINSPKFIRQNEDWSISSVDIPSNQLQDFDFDQEQTFSYIISKGTSDSKIYKVEMNTMEQKKFSTFDSSSLDKIRNCLDGKYFLLSDNNFFSPKLIKVPSSIFEDGAEATLKLADYPTIPLKGTATDLHLSKDGKRVIVGSRNLNPAIGGLYTGTIYVIDLEPFEVLQTLDTDDPQTSIKSYIPPLIKLEVTGSSTQEQFLAHSYREHELEWRPSQGQNLSDVAFYLVICDNEILQQLNPASSTFFHCVSKKRGRLLYKIQGINSLGEVVAEGELLL